MPALESVHEGLAGLSVVCPRAYYTEDECDHTAYLHSLTAALPSLGSISLQHCPCTLPPTSTLTGLTALSAVVPRVDGTYGPLCASVGPYLTRIGSLGVSVGSQDMQSPRQRSGTVSSHQPPYELTDQLVTLLQTHAPALTHLSVRGLALRQSHKRPWGLQQLTCSEPVTAEGLWDLPRSTVDKVNLGGTRGRHSHHHRRGKFVTIHVCNHACVSV